MHYLNSATLQRYRDDGVEYVRVWAAEDERTCDTCGSYHEKIYPIEKCPVLPFHPNCRCTILPVTDEEILKKYFETEGIKFDSDIGEAIIEKITGLSKQKKDFEKGLELMKNKDAKVLLEQSFKRSIIVRGKGRRSYFSVKDRKVYLAKSAGTDVIAHELFHEIDETYGLTDNGMLKDSIQADYQKLQEDAKMYGITIHEMLYLQYPEVFKKMEMMVKEEYRGISDILHGMSDGEIYMGYSHKSEYWKKRRRLEKESWAQYGRMYYMNGDALEVARQIFPRTSEEIEQRIRRMMK